VKGWWRGAEKASFEREMLVDVGRSRLCWLAAEQRVVADAEPGPHK
jgi:hypothetical protein